MKRNSIGRYVEVEARGQRHAAFIPASLPPAPTLRWEDRLVTLLAEAADALGELRFAGRALPNQELFRRSCVSIEADLSSRMGGSQPHIGTVLVREIKHKSDVQYNGVREEKRCLEAIEHGWERLESDSAAINNELLLKLHAILLQDKERIMPGQFRRDHVAIASSSISESLYVPPPWTEVESCMQNLQHFLQGSEDRMPDLARAGLAHVQFQMIHPFLDGNGRVGRMLTNLMLGEPLLYLSRHIFNSGPRYYDLLNTVRLTGDWEAWMEFFLEGVRDTAKHAVRSVEGILKLFGQDRKTIECNAGRRVSHISRIHEVLMDKGMASVLMVAEETKLTYPTVAMALIWLKDQGIVQELTGKRRNRLFAYQRYLDILSEGAV